ncbi:nuclease [Vibrio albus]|uniref:Nuclease n=1 Tax=Vibrio albus TaxID=2200953 RepID=A0A2U3BDP6_9VIBR|nr:thermonuclease family protein [Vibrio albus]PWI34926.1 nuclease [Vibrio albus]
MFRKTLLFACVIAVSFTCQAAKKTYGNAVVAEVLSIYDADTFRVNIQGWVDIIGNNMPIRVNGVDAPEIRGKCPEEKAAARKAKQFTVEALRTANAIELRNMRRGKYFRILANVYVDGKELSALLINAGLARPYDGGHREGWCG